MSDVFDDALSDDETAFLHDFAVSSGQHGLLPRDQQKGPDPAPLDVLSAMGGPYAAVSAATDEPPNLPLDPFASTSSARPSPRPGSTSGLPSWLPWAIGGVVLAAGIAAVAYGRRA